MKQYVKFDRHVDLNRAIRKAWKDADNLTEWREQISHIFIVQQFYPWGCFKSLVEDLTGYKF